MKNFCLLPWTSIAANTVGTTRPCCISYDEITKPDGTAYNLNTDSIQDIFHSEYMINLRQQFLDGKKPANCEKCWSEESVGKKSKRQNHYTKMGKFIELVDFNDLTPDTLLYLDLKLGNICNLKCRICSPFTSSRRAQEILSQIPYESRKTHPVKQLLVSGEWPRTSRVFWQEIQQLLPRIKYLDFTGGEPFLIREHFDLLKQSIERGCSKYQILYYNTNATQLPHEVLDLWSHFKKVEVSVSVDNVGSRFELERSGANWNQVNDNISVLCAWTNLLTNLEIHLCTTVSIQNVYYLDELCNWIDTKAFDYVFFNLVHDPDWISISSLTPEAKKLVIDKLGNISVSDRYRQDIDNILDFIQNSLGTNGEKFRTEMKRLDSLRNEDFEITHPEIAQAMNYATT